MARTVDLTKIRDAFITDLTRGAEAWEASQDAKAARRKTVAEDIFLRFVVGWESFASEWFIGCVNHDASHLKAHTEQQLQDWVESQLPKRFKRYKVTVPALKVTLAKHPKVSEVRALLDPNERNIEFDTLQDLADRANTELAPRFHEKVNAVIAAGGGEIVETAIAIRNVLAHRSANSVTVMKQRVSAFPTYPQLRKPTLSRTGVGPYLDARTLGGQARLEVFRNEFEQIAHRLVP